MSWRVPITRAALLLMETMWTYAAIALWVALTAKGGEPSFLGVALVVFLSYGISRGLQNSDLDISIIRIWGTVASLLVFYAIVRVDFFGSWRLWDLGWANDLFSHTAKVSVDQSQAFWGIPVMWLAWMRGIVRGQDRYGWNDIIGSFGIGVLVIAAVEVLQGLTPDTPALVRQLPVPFGALGLISVGLAQANRSEGSGRSFNLAWIAGVGGAIAVIAAIAGLFAVAYTEAAGHGLGQTAQTVGDAVASIGAYLIWPLDQVVEGLYRIVNFFIHLLGLSARGETQPPPDSGNLSDCVSIKISGGLSSDDAVKACNGTSTELPGFVAFAIRAFVFLLAFYVMARLTLSLFKRFQKRQSPSELKESTYADGRLAKDLGDLLGAFVRRFRPNIRLGRERLDPVQRLYFDMVDDAEGRGVVRKPGQTTLELAPSLARTYQGEAPIDITDVFDEVRYGGHAPSEGEAKRLRSEWEALQAQVNGR